MAKVKIKLEGLEEFRAQMEGVMKQAIEDSTAHAAAMVYRRMMTGINDRDAIEGEYEVVERRPMLGDGDE